LFTLAVVPVVYWLVYGERHGEGRGEHAHTPPREEPAP
jgi:hypothetical protein